MRASEKCYDISDTEFSDTELLAIKAALEVWYYLLERTAHPLLLLIDYMYIVYLRSAKYLEMNTWRQESDTIEFNWVRFGTQTQTLVIFCKPASKPVSV